MIRKSGNRLSEKIMLKQRDKIMMRFPLNRIMILGMTPKHERSARRETVN